MAAEDHATAAASALSYLRVNPGAAPQVKAFVDALWDLKFNEDEALLHLLDTEAAVAMSRTAAVSTTMSRVTSARNAGAGVNALLVALETRCGSPCSNRSVVAARSAFNSGNTRLNSFNRSLPYLDPIVPENSDPAAPGAQRGRTPIIHPHGDHQRELARAAALQSQLRTAVKAQTEASRRYPALGTVEAYWGSAYGKIQGNLGRALQLFVGVEHPAVAPVIDRMFQSSSTRRTRQFFRVQHAHELLVNGDHDPDDLDVTGRMMARGVGYDLNQLCINAARHIRDEATPPKIQAWVDGIAASASLDARQREILLAAASRRLSYQEPLGLAIDNWCGAWFHLDDMASQILAFRKFTVVGPPPIQCGPATACPDCTPTQLVTRTSPRRAVIDARCSQPPP
jgi:hypothetical protein